jgi:hypothetical protein
MDTAQRQEKIRELIKAYDKESDAFDLALKQKSETDQCDTNRLTLLTQIMCRAERHMEDISKELNELGHHVRPNGIR